LYKLRKKIDNNKEEFIHTDIESWKYKGKFDFVFSMESLYYADSIEIALQKIYKLLKPGGELFCGTDFYTDNKATARWAGIMKIQMHLHSKKNGDNYFSM
jgi:Methyltransferase domain.